MKKAKSWIMIVLLSAVSGFFAGCVTDTASLKVEKTLPREKLAYYNDTFDKLRTDLWEKAGYIHNEAQKSNFKLGKTEVKEGKLWVQTETGCFSTAGLGSSYTLRGDFDIQVDCQIDFLEGVYDMDQLLVFAVIGKEKEIGKDNTVFMCLLRMGVRDFSTFFSATRKSGELHVGNWHKIEKFNGSLRIVRIGDEVSTLYRLKEATEWKKLDAFRFPPGEVMLGLKLQNFVTNRASITASASATATFDNFRINAAEQIIEEEI